MSHECYMNVTFRFCFRSPLKSLKLPVFKGLSTDLWSHSFLHISFYPLYIKSNHNNETRKINLELASCFPARQEVWVKEEPESDYPFWNLLQMTRVTRI